MRLYVDEDSAHAVLVGLLVKAGHDIRSAGDFNRGGDADPVHLTRAIRDGRILFSRNHDDFKLLHELALAAGGRHPGILIVRFDNDPTRDLSPRGVVRALRNLESSGLGTADQLLILNQFR